ncbi:MAG: hypothetical protein ACR2ND_00900 [Solirubrobacteraceae bacterium]
MAQADIASWWAEVEHLREPLERRSRAGRSDRRPGAAHTTERRTIKIRGQVVPGAPRRELRDAVALERFEPYDLEAVATAQQERRAASPLPRPRRTGPRRPPPRPRERIGSRPDRIAGWAVLFVLLMGLIAATSAHGSLRPAQGVPGSISATSISSPALPPTGVRSPSYGNHSVE